MVHKVAIELDNVTTGDYLNLYKMRGDYVVISDSRVINLIDKDGNKHGCDYR